MKWHYLLALADTSDENTREVVQALDAFERVSVLVKDQAAATTLVQSAELTLVNWMRECAPRCCCTR